MIEGALALLRRHRVGGTVVLAVLLVGVGVVWRQGTVATP
jgi:hypothetical protein